MAVAEPAAPPRVVGLAAGSKLYTWEGKSAPRSPITGEEHYDP
jgi:hypothetical protein